MNSTDNEMPASIRVAVSSNHEARLDGHFGSCARFLIYQVSPLEIRFIGERSTAEKEAANEKNAYLAELISDCQILYVLSIGGPAAAKVVKHSIHPVKYIEETDVDEVLSKLQTVLAEMPPPWLAKVMGYSHDQRVRFATS